MRYLLAILSLAGLSFSACAQAEDHLVPCDEFLQAYESRVEAIAQGVMPGTVDFWVTVIPSFEPEWSVGISSDKGQHLLTFVIFDQSLWHGGWVSSGPNTMRHDPSAGHVQPQAKTAHISPDLYQTLRSEWKESISNSRPSEIFGLDGVTYNFKLPGQCASVWSPETDTRNGKLVALVGLLRELAAGESQLPIAENESAALMQLQELSNP